MLFIYFNILYYHLFSTHKVRHQLLLENVYHEFEKNALKFSEYHIDNHPIFLSLTPKLSILCEANVCPFLFIGLDESCFKQYNFSQKYWTEQSGEMKLLLKSDGYT